MEPCQVNVAISRALEEAAPAYRRKAAKVTAELGATHPLVTAEEVLYQALHTIFLCIPARLTPGGRLHVVTRDRAGGDVELVWEADEVVASEGDAHPLTEDARVGDILDLAIDGLATFCRARAGHIALEDTPAPGGASTRRRYLFLIPTLDRTGWRAR